MKQSLKQRLIGAIVLVALAVIFLPMLLTGPVDRSQVSVPMEIPPKPTVKPSTQLPDSDDETATRPPPESITEAPAPVDEPAPADQASAPPESDGDAETPDEAPDNAAAAEAAGDDAGAPEQAEAAAETVPDEAAEDPEAVPEQGNWAVQVGGFRSRGNALGLQEKLRGQGFTVYVDQTDWKGKPLYRVRVGPVLSEDEAESLKARLNSEAGLEGLVVSR